MDRNRIKGIEQQGTAVALRKESVDRNDVRDTTAARPSVALRKESVDRNMRYINKHLQQHLVALRKESVDRNIPPLPTSQTSSRRSPQGERG